MCGVVADLALLLIQIVLILSLVRILGYILKRLNQPMVIGEIIAGILLGPSCFGYIPGFSHTIFPTKPNSGQTTNSLSSLALFANIGLIFFMFFLGMEVDVDLMRKAWKQALPIASMFVCFALFIVFVC